MLRACLRGVILISSTSRQWEAAIGRYSALFTASGIRTQDILLRLSNPKLYIVYVHEYLEGLEDEWEDRLTCLLYTSPSPRD